jgi:hypothetical protein
MFEVWWSGVHVLVFMRPLDEDNANRLIDLAASFDAPLYDPQTGERFRGDAGAVRRGSGGLTKGSSPGWRLNEAGCCRVSRRASN